MNLKEDARSHLMLEILVLGHEFLLLYEKSLTLEVKFAGLLMLERSLIVHRIWMVTDWTM